MTRVITTVTVLIWCLNSVIMFGGGQWLEESVIWGSVYTIIIKRELASWKAVVLQSGKIVICPNFNKTNVGHYFEPD